ncbi:hypothetical protein BD310DRAFT_910096 [Dichomitus squalens]|uniref:Uncharacterized protein n=1 Tax=Dichomitus squalens TaxID=114155 RepID=A0A4Q9PCA2_9APHY|nr:hypothetical protein BD310DRAFT_910096 [Dichomitus squalens]
MSVPLLPLRTPRGTYGNCSARLRNLLSESDTLHDSHLVRVLSALDIYVYGNPSPQISASLPASKLQHLPIQAPAIRTNASSSRITASAAVVQNHWHQVEDCVGCSKRLQPDTEKGPDWEAVVPLL